MNTLLRQGVVGTLLLAALCLTPTHSHSQEASKRRLLERTAAPYPALARSMALTGVVKVEVLVAPDGTAKTVDIKGGHPVLAQSVVNAVRHWRWEASAHESREVVEIKFSGIE